MAAGEISQEALGVLAQGTREIGNTGTLITREAMKIEATLGSKIGSETGDQIQQIHVASYVTCSGTLLLSITN
jgi:hypothetical protein